MIGTIRKHSSWLWWVVAVLTIGSFIWWGASPASRYGSGSHGLGTIYGKTITPEAFAAAQREYYLFYWWQHGEFPGKSADFSRADMDRETYFRLLLTAKAKEMGVHVSEEAQAAQEVLKSLGRNGQVVPMSEFVKRVLEPAGLTAADFQRYVTDDLLIQQMVHSLGLAGSLMAPQEAGKIYDREHQEISADAVFFSATNYISPAPVPPALLGQFYTNEMASYRLPDRVALYYVQFDLTNFLAEAAQKDKTNIEAAVEAEFAQQGMQAVPGAKTPEDAKATLRETITHRAAGALAAEQARQFVTQLFGMDPVKAENILQVAKANNLTVHATAPFTEADGPEEFIAPPQLTQYAFKLNAESPYSQAIPGTDAVYVIALKASLPSAIQPLSAIEGQVTADFKRYEGVQRARAAGTNFFFNAMVQMATGKTFAQTAVAAKLTPVALKPFSLSSQVVPEAEGLAEVNEIKNAAFSTQPGHLSRFEPSADGGFVLFVQSLLPVDEAAKKADMPRFLAQVRRSRENEAFNLWFQAEASRELRDTPLYKELMGGDASSASR